MKNVSLKEFNGFSIEGRAKYFFFAKNRKEIKEAFLFAKKNRLDFFVLGRGTNTLFEDKTHNRAIIKNEIKFFDLEKIPRKGLKIKYRNKLSPIISIGKPVIKNQEGPPRKMALPYFTS